MATKRKFKVTITVRKKGSSDAYVVRIRTVEALNALEAEYLVTKAMRRTGFDVGIVLEINSGLFRFSCMLRPKGNVDDKFVEFSAPVKAVDMMAVPKAARDMMEGKGYEVGAIFNIYDNGDAKRGFSKE